MAKQELLYKGGKSMDIMTVAIVSAFNIMCFVIGAKVGQKVSKDEPIKLPRINPMETIRKIQADKETSREQQRINTILQNIDNYDGTSAGQKDI